MNCFSTLLPVSVVQQDKRALDIDACGSGTLQRSDVEPRNRFITNLQRSTRNADGEAGEQGWWRPFQARLFPHPKTNIYLQRHVTM